MMRIRTLNESDFSSVIEIGRRLKISDDGRSGWFTEGSCEKLIPVDIKHQNGFVALENDKIIGFITYTTYDYYTKSSDSRPIIGWIGTYPDHHGRGVGTSLVKRVEDEIMRSEEKELFVETPSKEAGMGTDYEKTYKFFMECGFTVNWIRKSDEPDNQCGCDMAILKKVLK